MHTFARHDAWCFDINNPALGRFDRAFAINRIAQRINHPAQQALANRHIDNRFGPLNRVAFFDVAVIAEDHHADIISFEVQGHAFDTIGKFNHFPGLDIIKTIDPGDAVADGKHLADFGDFCFFAKIP